MEHGRLKWSVVISVSANALCGLVWVEDRVAYVMGRIPLFFVYYNNETISTRSMVYVTALPATTATYGVLVLTLIEIYIDNVYDI